LNLVKSHLRALCMTSTCMAQAGRRQGDRAIGRFLADTVDAVPLVSRDDLEVLFNQNVQVSPVLSLRHCCIVAHLDSMAHRFPPSLTVFASLAGRLVGHVPCQPCSSTCVAGRQARNSIYPFAVECHLAAFNFAATETSHRDEQNTQNRRKHMASKRQTSRHNPSVRSASTNVIDPRRSLVPSTPWQMHRPVCSSRTCFCAAAQAHPSPQFSAVSASPGNVSIVHWHACARQHTRRHSAVSSGSPRA